MTTSIQQTGRCVGATATAVPSTPMRAPLLFLSHAGVDSEAALRLADLIEASPAAREAGMKVWVDRRSLLAGTSWQQQLEDAIAHHSTAFAIYLSAAGAEHWVRIEVRAALDRLITDGRNGIAYPFIPVIAADAGDIARLPRFAQQYQGVSLQDEQGLQKLIGVVLGSEPAVPVPLVDEPFRGLDAFEADQAHLFFGRERETHELIDRLRRNGLIIVVGDSGSGKSSVVKAGVVPGFREGLVADPLAPRPPAAAWHVVQMRPLNNPLEALIIAVSTAARGLTGLNVALLGSAVAGLRKGDPAAVADVLREGAPADACVLLVIDQFEELWTQTTDAALRHTFLDGVLSATAFGGLRFRSIATMRRDYFFQVATHDGLRERLDAPQREARFNLHRMSEQQLRDCIEKPLALAGERSDEAKSLADEVLRDVGDEPGEMALIEMALFKAWREREKHPHLLDAYKAIGRVEGALGQAADEALERLAKDFGTAAASLAETVFVRLVVRSADGGVTRRVARKSEFTPQAWQIAQALASRDYSRLLVIGRVDRGSAPSPDEAESAEGDAMTAELAHEQIATQWGQYVRWLRGTAEAAADKQTLDRLIPRAQDWAAHGRRVSDLTMTRAEKIDFGGIRARRTAWLSADERAFVDRGRWRARLPWVLGGTAVVVFLAAGASYTVSLQAQLTEAQAANIWNRLSLTGHLSLLEVAAVRDLMAADDDTKLAFAEKLKVDEGLAVRFNRNPWLLTRALAGTSPATRERLIECVALAADADANASPEISVAVGRLGAYLASPRTLGAMLGAINATGDPSARDSLAQGLAAVAGKLDADQAARAIELLLGAIKATRDSRTLAELAKALAAVPGKLDAGHLARAIEPLLIGIEIRGLSFNRWAGADTLAKELAALAGKLDADQSARAIEPLLSAIKATSDPRARGVLAQGLAALAGNLDAGQAAHATEPLLGAIKATSSGYELGALAQALAALAGNLDADQFARAIEPLLGTIKQTNDHRARSMLAIGLAALAGKLDADQSARAIEPLLSAIKTTSDPSVLGMLAQALAAVPGNLDEDHLARAIEPLLDAIKATSDPRELGVLVNGLAVIAGTLDADQSARAIKPLLGAIKATSSAYALGALAQGLAALAGKLDVDPSAHAIEPLLGAIKATNNPSELGMLAKGLAALAGKLDAGQAARAFPSLLKASLVLYERRSMQRELAAIASKLDANQLTREFESLLSAIKATSGRDGFDDLGQGLGAVTSNLDAGQAAHAMEPLLDAIKATSDPRVLGMLVNGLAALAGNLDAGQAAHAMEPLLGAIKATSDTDELAQLAKALAAIAGKIEVDPSARAIEPLLSAIKATSDPRVLGMLVQALAAVPGKLDEDHLARAIEPLLGAIKAKNDPDALDRLAYGLAALAGKLDAESAARVVVEALGNPFSEPKSVEVLVRSVGTRPPKGLGEGAGLWELLAWGAARQ